MYVAAPALQAGGSCAAGKKPELVTPMPGATRPAGKVNKSRKRKDDRGTAVFKRTEKIEAPRSMARLISLGGTTSCRTVKQYCPRLPQVQLSGACPRTRCTKLKRTNLSKKSSKASLK